MFVFMPSGREHEFAELIVDRRALESFPTESSAYHISGGQQGAYRLQFLKKLRWHISHSLSPRQKEVIRLYLRGKRERDIAVALGVKQQVVNIYKWRAIKKLRRAFGA
ncbi:MAG: LuxR C-terminal-related transcriptional regulator [Candidatus Zixiibacteriota bacterium]